MHRGVLNLIDDMIALGGTTTPQVAELERVDTAKGELTQL